jgi:hypothetical protein
MKMPGTIRACISAQSDKPASQLLCCLEAPSHVP